MVITQVPGHPPNGASPAASVKLRGGPGCSKKKKNKKNENPVLLSSLNHTTAHPPHHTTPHLGLTKTVDNRAWWRGGVVACERGGVRACGRGGVVAWWRGGVVAWGRVFQSCA